MRKYSLALLLVITLGMTSCAKQSDRVPVLGAVVSCSLISAVGNEGGVALPCMDGKSVVHFSTLRGPLIVNVWGSWCAPCRDEIPIIRSFYSKAQNRLQILGVDVEEGNSSDGSNFVIEHGMTWPSLVDPDGRSRALFGMGVPVTW
ncbi:MAG: TlpA disulfide reductase family protein, partial [Actinobacteria bacterium]|nr:TlpA disulfide reductase family protein [Actinomycetota bacterium]